MMEVVTKDKTYLVTNEAGMRLEQAIEQGAEFIKLPEPHGNVLQKWQVQEIRKSPQSELMLPGLQTWQVKDQQAQQNKSKTKRRVEIINGLRQLVKVEETCSL